MFHTTRGSKESVFFKYMTSDGSMSSWDSCLTQQYLATEIGFDVLKGEKKKDPEQDGWGRRWKELADGMNMIKNKLKSDENTT